MSCTRMEGKILGYVDGRLKESERLEMEKHLATCSTCQLRVNEFRLVSGFLDELPEIQPSPAFDVRVRARVAAEPKKQSWWALLVPSPRVAFAATALLAAMIWIGVERPIPRNLFDNPKEADAEMMQDLQSFDDQDQDVIWNFEPLKDLPQPVQADQTDNPGTQTNTM
jgi:anti-sigma factor RsiW